MTSISTQDDLITWAAAGGTGTLTQNILMENDTNIPLQLGKNCTLEGGRYTITLMTDNVNGLFEIIANGLTISISNLIVDADNITATAAGCGLMIKDLNNSNTTLTVTNCGVNGIFDLGAAGGGILGPTTASGSGSTVIITGCYATGALNRQGSGGIVGEYGGRLGDITVTDCYATGIISGEGCGGIVGRRFGEDNTGTAIVRNCYATGNLDADGCGGIVGSLSGDQGSANIVIDNCYHTGDFTERGTNKGSITGGGTRPTHTITNCYSLYASSTGVGDGAFIGSLSGGSANVLNSAVASVAGTWNATLGTSLVDNDGQGNTDVWITSGDFSNGFGLTTFNTDPWDQDTSYISNTSEAAFSAASGSGDPHIFTIYNNVYDLKTNKYFKFFDNMCKKDRFVVNASVKCGPYPIWRNKEYIDNVYIFHNDSYVLLDTGFRGNKVKILDQKGDLIVKDYDLPMKENIKMFCSQCKFRSRFKKEIEEHEWNTEHTVLKNVRNSIRIRISTEENDYTVNVMNVDNENFNPCKVTVIMKHKRNISKYDGAIMLRLNYDISNIGTLEPIRH